MANWFLFLKCSARIYIVLSLLFIVEFCSAQKYLQISDQYKNTLSFEKCIANPEIVHRICVPCNYGNYTSPNFKVYTSKKGYKLVNITTFTKQFKSLDYISFECSNLDFINFAHHPNLTTLYFPYSLFSGLPQSLKKTKLKTIMLDFKGSRITVDIKDTCFVSLYAKRNLNGVCSDSTLNSLIVERTYQYDYHSEDLGKYYCIIAAESLILDLSKWRHDINNCITSNARIQYLQLTIDSSSLRFIQNMDFSPNRKKMKLKIVQPINSLNINRIKHLKEMMLGKNIELEIE
jgi:hypothetical protein